MPSADDLKYLQMSPQELDLDIGGSLLQDTFGAKPATDAEKRSAAVEWFDANLGRFRKGVCGNQLIRNDLFGKDKQGAERAVRDRGRYAGKAWRVSSARGGYRREVDPLRTRPVVRRSKGAKQMSPLSLQDAIAIEGGPLELGSPPPGIPDRTIREVVGTLTFLVNVFLNNLEDRESGLFIALTRSSGLSCRVRQVEEGASAILVPAGLVGRLRTMCRTLLRYWDKETHTVFLNSPLDRIAEDQWQVPPKLAPLFDHKLSGDQFWTQLQTLDASLDLDPRFEPDVTALMHLGLVFLLAHEFAHVFFRHFEFVAMIQQTKPNDVDRIRRGLELQADSFAGTWATTIFKAQTGPKADTETIARGFQRQSYVVTAIMAMFDAHKKYVGFYDRGDYNHPLIRREIFADAVGREVSAEGKEFYDFWHEVEGAGWKRAVDAFADLNLDAMKGTFGEIDKNKLAYPLQAMSYGIGASLSVLAKLLEEANELLEDVKKQVAAFNHFGVSGSAV